jgi:hypothetical protein
LRSVVLVPSPNAHDHTLAPVEASVNFTAFPTAGADGGLD